MRTISEIQNNKQIKILRTIQENNLLRIECYFFHPITQKRWLVFFTVQFGWEHCSVGSDMKTPDWDVMCRVKDIFWGEDECCVEYHPKEEDYVNMHEHTLHIWKQVGIDFPMPPSIMVGFKDMSHEETSRLSKAFFDSLSPEELQQIAEDRGLHIGNRSMKRKAGMK